MINPAVGCHYLPILQLPSQLQSVTALGRRYQFILNRGTWVTGQLADAIGDFACLVFLFGGICETARCPVRELAFRELACPRVVQLPARVCDQLAYRVAV